MRIALFFESDPRLEGGTQQSLSTAEALTRSNATGYQVIVFTRRKETYQRLLTMGIPTVYFEHRGYRILDRWSSTILGGALFTRIRRFGFHRLGRHLDALLDDHQISLAIFNDWQNDVILRIGDHPLIVTVWDLDHRDNPDFPESFTNRLFERVERSLHVTLQRAVAIIANSNSGAKRIEELYRVDSKRIVVLPFVPSLAVRRHAAGERLTTAEQVREKYQLPERYVFYPAHAAYHKNNLYLFEGLRELEIKKGISLSAVLCGGGPNEVRERITKQYEALGLSAEVHMLGFVPDGDLPGLYEGATCLVTPSYFGPTNLPPIEAAALGCPVICSDLPGCREQMGDAALYCRLDNPSHLAELLGEIIGCAELREKLINNGKQLSTKLEQVDYGSLLAPVLNDFAYKRRRWAWPDVSEVR